ncbi:MAG: hypothetical protein ACYC6Y_06070, partial [Thermoguttaceae bacterium]
HAFTFKTLADARLFRPDIVKISLDSETVLLLREVVSSDLGVHKRRDEQSAPAAPILAEAPEGKP